MNLNRQKDNIDREEIEMSSKYEIHEDPTNDPSSRLEARARPGQGLGHERPGSGFRSGQGL
jgi:hypothetical protein